MFLKSEAKKAVTKVTESKKEYDAAIKYLEESCEHRYSVCCTIRDVVRIKYEELLKTIADVANKDTTGKITELQNAVYDVDLALIEATNNFDKEVERINSIYSKNGSMLLGLGIGVAVRTVMGSGMAIVTSLSSANMLAGGSLTTVSLLAGEGAVGGVMSLGSGALGWTNPIGWGLIAAGAVWSGYSYRSKNKKAIEEAESAVKEMTEATLKIRAAENEITRMHALNKKRVDDVIAHIDNLNLSLRKEGLTMPALEECQIVIETTKQLASYMSERITF